MNDDGYIKFNCNWIKKEPIPDNKIKKINEWRDKLYDLGLIGACKDGVGFGNISIRLENSNDFIITGSATGNLKKLNENYYTKVIDFDLEKNSLTCEGPIKASSESMTHAAIYRMDKKINAVIHVHNPGLWNKLMGKVPTTSKDAAYGTPKMAKEVVRLFKETNVKNKEILVMGGHKEGVITFGKDLDEAGKILLKYYNKK